MTQANCIARLRVGVLLLSFLFINLLRVQPVQAVGILVQQAPLSVTTSNTASVSATLPATPRSGDLLVAVCTLKKSATLSVSGFTPAAPSSAGTLSQGIFYKVANGSEQTVTCNTSSQGAVAFGLQVFDYGGVAASPFDQTGTTAQGSSKSVNSGSATPSTGQSLVFSAITSINGTAYSNVTSGYNVRVDTSSSLHFGVQDNFITNTTAQEVTATNNSAFGGTWVGQIAIFKLLPLVLTTDIVDAGGVSVPSPSATFTTSTFSYSCQTVTSVLGTTNQQINVYNTLATPGWQLSIAATNGASALWSSGGTSYDYNDPTGGGCSDGSDGDTVAGDMTVKPAAGTITPASGCTNTGVTLGSNTAFSEGSVNTIVLASAGSGAALNCSWNITGIGLSQTIPAEQRAGTYALGMTITLLAE